MRGDDNNKEGEKHNPKEGWVVFNRLCSTVFHLVFTSPPLPAFGHFPRHTSLARSQQKRPTRHKLCEFALRWKIGSDCSSVRDFSTKRTSPLRFGWHQQRLRQKIADLRQKQRAVNKIKIAVLRGEALGTERKLSTNIVFSCQTP